MRVRASVRVRSSVKVRVKFKVKARVIRTGVRIRVTVRVRDSDGIGLRLGLRALGGVVHQPDGQTFLSFPHQTVCLSACLFCLPVCLIYSPPFSTSRFRVGNNRIHLTE